MARGGLCLPSSRAIAADMARRALIRQIAIDNSRSAPHKASHVGIRYRGLRPDLAGLFLAAAAVALRRLGQPDRAAAAARPWRTRSLPQLGMGRVRAAPRLARAGGRSARPLRQPVVA